MIPFDQVISDQDQDPDLLPKLKQEGSGVLNWALAGLSDYRANGLYVSQEVEDATLAYRTDQDILGEWITDCCNVVPGASTEKGKLYGSYKFWIETHGHRPMSQTKFTRKLRERGYPRDSGRRNITGLELIPLGISSMWGAL